MFNTTRITGIQQQKTLPNFIKEVKIPIERKKINYTSRHASDEHSVYN